MDPPSERGAVVTRGGARRRHQRNRLSYFNRLSISRDADFLRAQLSFRLLSEHEREGRGLKTLELSTTKLRIHTIDRAGCARRKTQDVKGSDILPARTPGKSLF
jgi:hypothetical protein